MGGRLSCQAQAAASLVAEEYCDSSAVIAVHSTAEWSHHLQNQTQSNKLMVIDFSASWCGPCRNFEPSFKAMSARFTDAVFLKIDVDELPKLPSQWNVQTMPTFVVVKRGQEVGRVAGAKKDELERMIQLQLN